MRKKPMTSVLSALIAVFMIGVLSSSVMAFSNNHSQSSESVPPEIQKASHYKATHQLQPVDIDTVDVYGDKGQYIVTVPMDVWKTYETKGTQFWKSHAKEFVKTFHMPVADPESLAND